MMVVFADNILLVLVAASQLSVAQAAAAPAATIWSVVTTPTGTELETEVKATTIAIKPVATLDGGAVTQYAEVIVESLIVFPPPPGKTHAPITVITQPATITNTFEQGSATLGFHRPEETKSLGDYVSEIENESTRNCTIDPSKLQGSCVEVDKIVLIPDNGFPLSTTLSTTSFSGSLIPIATITPSSSSAMSLVSTGALISLGLSAIVGFVLGLA